MRTKDRAATASRRRAWTFEDGTPPTVADFRAGGARRAAFLRWHVGDRLRAMRDETLHRAFALLPTEAASAIGGWLGRFIVPRWLPKPMARGRENLRRIRPDWTEDEIEAALHGLYDNIGRLQAEFSVLDRLLAEGRIRVEGREHWDAAVARGPVVLVCAHIGNWETIPAVCGATGREIGFIYMPPASRARHAIARRVRSRLGVTLMPPGRAAVRPALRILEGGGTVILFCDEVMGGKVLGPFLGRRPHVDGNAAIAVRLARRTGASLVPAHAVREPGCRFTVHFRPALDLPPCDDPAARLLDDVRLVDAAIEAVVRRHPDSWYFVDNRL